MALHTRRGLKRRWDSFLYNGTGARWDTSFADRLRFLGRGNMITAMDVLQWARFSGFNPMCVDDYGRSVDDWAWLATAVPPVVRLRLPGHRRMTDIVVNVGERGGGAAPTIGVGSEKPRLPYPLANRANLDRIRAAWLLSVVMHDQHPMIRTRDHRGDVFTGMLAQGDALRLHILRGPVVIAVGRDESGRITPETGGMPEALDFIEGDAVSALCSRGFDWMATMLGAFLSAAHDTGLSGAMTESSPSYGSRGWSPGRLLPYALEDMNLGEWWRWVPGATGPADLNDPAGFGRELARAWLDVMCDRGVRPWLVDSFPSLSLLIRWRAAASAVGSGFPACATGDPTSMGWMLSHVRTTARAHVCAEIAAALESDGRRDWSDTTGWAGDPRMMATPDMMRMGSGSWTMGGESPYMPDGVIDFWDILSDADTPAKMLAMLDLCDVLAMASGLTPPADPFLMTPDAYGHGDLPPMVAMADMGRVAGTLGAGLPLDMAAEDPALHGRSAIGG